MLAGKSSLLYTDKECSTGATPLEPKAQRGLLVCCMGMQKPLKREADTKKSFEIYSTGPMHYIVLVRIHYRAIKISHSIKLRPKLISFLLIICNFKLIKMLSIL